MSDQPDDADRVVMLEQPFTSKTLTAIGVDTGMVQSAIAVRWEDGAQRIFCHKRTQEGLLGNAAMIRFLRQGLAEILAQPWADPLYVVTERLAGMRGAAENNLALMWGVIEAVMSAQIRPEDPLDPREQAPYRSDDSSARIILPYPGQLKIFTTGKGNTQKSECVAHICRHWPEAPIKEDPAEAFALMQFGLCRRDFDAGRIDKGATGAWTAYQFEIATKDTRSRKKPPFEVLDISVRDANQVWDRSSAETIYLDEADNDEG